MIVLPAPPPTRSSALPHGVRIVESDQPLTVRCVHCQRIAQPVRPLRSRFRSHHDELHPVSDVINEQRLAVKVEQRVQPGIAVRRRHFRKLSTSDNERKTRAASSGRRNGPESCRELLADIPHLHRIKPLQGCGRRQRDELVGQTANTPRLGRNPAGNGRPSAPRVIVPRSPGGPKSHLGRTGLRQEPCRRRSNRIDTLQLDKHKTTKNRGGPMTNGLVGLPIEGLEELFAAHRIEHVIDL